MTLDLNQLHTLFLIVLPALVGIVAGLIRQDKFPRWANETILLVVIGLVALSQALLDGKLGGSPITDFMLVGGYCTAFMSTTTGKSLLGSVQTVTSVGGKVSDIPPAPHFDLGSLANQLAPFLAQELVKLKLSGSMPAVQPTQVYGMNSGVPGQPSTVLTDPPLQQVQFPGQSG